MVGFALAEYSNGDDADPIRLPFADQCHARFLQHQLQLLPLMLSQHLPGAGLPPATNAHQTPAHVHQHAHDPVAVIQRSSDPEIQTKAAIVNEIPGGLLKGVIKEIPSRKGVMALRGKHKVHLLSSPSGASYAPPRAWSR
jgi:hypothetical protein